MSSAFLYSSVSPETSCPIPSLPPSSFWSTNLCSFAYVKRKVRFRRIGKRDLTGLIKPLLVMLLLTNASMFYTTLDRLFLSVFAKDTPAYTSFYTFSLTITQLITNVINAIVLATIPRLAAYLGKTGRKTITGCCIPPPAPFSCWESPMSIGISVMAYPIMFIYGNEAYLPAGLTLAIFGVRCLLWLCDIVLANQVIFVHGKESLLTRIYFTGGAVNLLLNSLLVVFRQVRPEWMILTTIVSEIVLVLLQWRCVRLNFGKSIRVFDWHTLKYLLTAPMLLSDRDPDQPVRRAAVPLRHAFFHYRRDLGRRLRRLLRYRPARNQRRSSVPFAPDSQKQNLPPRLAVAGAIRPRGARLYFQSRPIQVAPTESKRKKSAFTARSGRKPIFFIPLSARHTTVWGSPLHPLPWSENAIRTFHKMRYDP